MDEILDSYKFDIDSIELFNEGLSKLPDLTRFIKLKTLDCYNNQLTELNNLPESLTELYCGSNRLTTLNNLPNTLTKLYCMNNRLTELNNLDRKSTRLNSSHRR